MLDVAIVGGGLCGLALARKLAHNGRHVHVFEARHRLGGRIETTADTRQDLGATWFWPGTQPLMTQLVRELRLREVAQHETGALLVSERASEPGQAVDLGRVQSGARRLEGGMGSLIAALARELPEERVHLGHVLTGVTWHPHGVELCFLRGGKLEVVMAQRVVLALPPRLLAERVRFEPALSPNTRRKLQETPTWMATQAKVVLSYEQAEWRDAGYSGNAFVCHDDAVLDEVFDACDPRSGAAALGGFVALDPAERVQLHDELPSLISEQVASVFGCEQRELAQSYRDWATELHTCSLRDRREQHSDHAEPTYGDAALRCSRWEQRLFFGGSETSEIEGGYLEGALHAAQRIARELTSLGSAPVQSAAGRRREMRVTERAEIFSARMLTLVA